MKWIVITGPTASGKTRLAAAVAREISGEIISVDSRQVFRGMDIGTGKDLSEYGSGDSAVRHHLIDIVNPGDDYHITAFQRDFANAIISVERKGNVPVLCGGTGLYLEAVLEGHEYTFIPVNPALREHLGEVEIEELKQILTGDTALPFQADMSSRKRMIRAIEIREYLKGNEMNKEASPPEAQPDIFILDLPREIRRERISARLKQRLEAGLIDEVTELRSRVADEVLIRYGLEYKYVVMYLKGELSYTEMAKKLETEIHRYSKRQMTWFRRMERKYGDKIHWIDALQPVELSVRLILDIYRKNKY